MDKDTFKSNLKTAKELILDEQKIVTYISLSKELCIHVNDAKSVLTHFIEDIRKNQPKTDISVSYILSGLLKDSSACTTVCSETNVEALRTSMKVIFYEHVYCVSRGIKAISNAALTTINKLDDFPLCTGLIRGNSCVKRTDNELENLTSIRNQNAIIPQNIKNVVKKTQSEKPKEVTKQIEKDKHEGKKVSEVKSEPVSSSKTPSPKKDVPTNNSKASAKKTNGTKPTTKGIAGFFNKPNGDVKKVNNKVEVEKTNVKVEKTEIAVKIEKEVKMNEDLPTTKKETTITKEKVEQNNKSNKSKDSSTKQIKKSAKVDKKRKRLLRVSDSESDTETNDPFADEEKMTVDQESDDEIPPTPSTNTVKITSGIVNPKKRRKIVDKTFTDEEGYVLTKKVEVYESCSDNEEEIKNNIKQEKENVKEVTTNIKTEKTVKDNGKIKKKLSPQKGKQQTLMSFFKKV